MSRRRIRFAALCGLAAAAALSIGFYSTSPARAAMVAYYSFDDTSGTGAGATVYNQGTAGAAMNGLLGTGGDAPTIVYDPTRGSDVLSLSPTTTTLGASYMEIDNIDSYMPSLTYSGSAWTFSMWIETGSSGGTFFSKGGTGASGSFSYANPGDSIYYLRNNNSGAGNWVGGVRRGGGYFEGNVSVDNSQWNLVTVEYAGSGSTPTIYTNGILNATTTENGYNPSKADNGTIVRVGWTSGNSGAVNFTGKMDDVAFWNQALAPGEAEALYNLNVGNLSSGGISAVLASYNDVNVEQLFQLSEGSGASASITSGGATIVWSPVSSLPSGGTLGQAWINGGDYYVALQSSGSIAGVVGVPQNVLPSNAFVWSGSVDNTWENSANWSLGGGSSTVPDGASVDVTFGAPSAAGSVVLNAGHTVGEVVFLGTVGTTVSGTGTLTFATTAGGASITVAGTNAISAPMALAVATSASVGSGAQLILSGPISGSGGLTMSGLGLLQLAGANTYAGGTDVAGGTLSVDTDARLGDPSGGLTFDGGSLLLTAAVSSTTSRNIALNAGGGTIIMGDPAGNLTVTQPISGAGALTKNGPGTLVLTANNSYSGTTTIAAGTLQLGNGGSGTSIGGTSNVVNNGTLVFDHADSVAFVPPISGSGSVQMVGTGLLILAGGNSYSGGTTVAGGTLSVGADNNLGAPSGPLAVSGGVFSANASFATARTILLGPPGASGQGTIDVAAGAVLTLNGPMTDNVGGAGGLTKTSGGMLVVAAPAGYSGPTNVGAGTLQLQSTSTIGGFGGSGTGWTVNSIGITSTPIAGNVLTLTDNNNNEARSAWYDLPISATSGFTASFTYTPVGSADGAAFVLQSSSSGLLAIGDSGGGSSLGYAPIPNSAALGFNIYSSHTIGAGYFTDGNMTENFQSVSPVGLTDGNPINVTLTYDPAAQTLSAFLAEQNTTNTYSTIIPNVNLQSLVGNSAYMGFTGADGGSTSTQTISNFSFSSNSASNILPVTTALSVAPGATFDVAGVNQTVASVNLTSGSIVDSVGTGSLSATAFNVTSGTIAANLSGAGAVLTASGSGLSVLSGSNSYSGGTQVTGGTLQLGNNAALGAGPLAVSGGTLDLAGFSPSVLGLSGSAGLITNSGAAAILDVNQASADTFGGTINNGASTVALQLDSGTLTLSGNNTYSGGTTVDGTGTLILANNEALADGSSLIVGDASAFGAVAPARFSAESSASIAPVPEPGTLLLALAAGAVLFKLRIARRRGKLVV